MPECSHPKILILVSLLFVALYPYLPFKFLIFIILVCLLFIHAISIHNYLSAGAYIIIMLVNNALTWLSSCVIANNAQKTAKTICPRLSSQCNKVHARVRSTRANILPL